MPVSEFSGVQNISKRDVRGKVCGTVCGVRTVHNSKKAWWLRWDAGRFECKWCEILLYLHVFSVLIWNSNPEAHRFKSLSC